MKKILCLILTVFLVFSLSACAGKEKDDDKTKIRLVLDWTPSTNHTGIYLAKSLGYYDKLGIELEILQPPDSGAVPLVGAAQAEFGISFQEELGPALAIDNPLPVEAVAGIISHNTSGIISLKEKGILSPKDLEGKRLIAWDTPLVAGIVEDLVTADGGDFSKVEMVFNNVTDAVSALQADADAIWIFYAWDGMAIEVAGLDTNYFDIATENPLFDFYTPVIVVNTDYAKENPQLVKDFLAATTQGYQYAMENPEKAAELYLEQVPELDYDMLLAGQNYLATRYQGDAPRWGEIDSQRWARFYDWMYEAEILENPVGEKGFTNQYLP